MGKKVRSKFFLKGYIKCVLLAIILLDEKMLSNRSLEEQHIRVQIQ